MDRSNQAAALAFSQATVGVFVIFVVGAILHYYMPVRHENGVIIEGVLLGIITAYHLNKVYKEYKSRVPNDEE